MPNLRERLEQRLRETLDPTHIELVDESHRHSRGLETHFNLLLVSERFDGQSRLQRHRTIHDALAELMAELHSLTSKARTPAEHAAESDGERGIRPAPACQGG